MNFKKKHNLEKGKLSYCQTKHESNKFSFPIHYHASAEDCINHSMTSIMGKRPLSKTH